MDSTIFIDFHKLLRQQVHCALIHLQMPISFLPTILSTSRFYFVIFDRQIIFSSTEQQENLVYFIIFFSCASWLWSKCAWRCWFCRCFRSFFFSFEFLLSLQSHLIDLYDGNRIDGTTKGIYMHTAKRHNTFCFHYLIE